MKQLFLSMDARTQSEGCAQSKPMHVHGHAATSSIHGVLRSHHGPHVAWAPRRGWRRLCWLLHQVSLLLLRRFPVAVRILIRQHARAAPPPLAETRVAAISAAVAASGPAAVKASTILSPLLPGAPNQTLLWQALECAARRRRRLRCLGGCVLRCRIAVPYFALWQLSLRLHGLLG